MQKISPYELAANPFQLIGKQWAMVTTRCADRVNTMTASWGGVGIMWGKPAAYVFIRPQRFTHEQLEGSALFSLCFLPEQYRKEMNYCGSHTGRAEDKLAACGLTAGELDGAPVLEQSETVLTLKKLYCQGLAPECIVERELDDKWYAAKDYHDMYVCEILGAYTK